MAIKKTMIEHDPGDVRRFYEMICFTRSLSPVRGNRIKQVFSVESDGFEIAKCRRDFADAIAYFCAYRANPDNVTAVALGRKNTKVVLWIASNANVPAKVIDFLNNSALNVVQRLACADMKQGQLPPSEHETALMILGKILQFSRKKIFKYYKPAIAAWKEICRVVNPQGSDNTNSDLATLCEWFQKEFYKSGVMLEECDMPDLAISCYIARTKKAFDILDHGSGQGNEQSLAYERLYKLLNKLGKHVLLFKRMVHAIVALRLDFQKGFVVEPITASTPTPIPLPQLSKRTMEKIIARVFPKEDERSRFYHHLSQFYNMEGIYQSLKLYKEKGRVRVHAEILLIDYFDKIDVDFLDNDDKYVGCSKPACYLCRNYTMLGVCLSYELTIAIILTSSDGTSSS